MSLDRLFEKKLQEARERGYVETVFGRRLWLPDIASSNQARRQGAERQESIAKVQDRDQGFGQRPVPSPARQPDGVQRPRRQQQRVARQEGPDESRCAPVRARDEHRLPAVWRDLAGEQRQRR